MVTKTALPMISPIQQEMLNRADSIMNAISSTVSKASNFAADQIPDIAMQFVTYGRVSLTAYLIIAILTVLLGLWLVIGVGVMNKCKLADRDGDWSVPQCMLAIAGAVISIIGLMTFVTNFDKCMMVWFAPKLWLIQTIATLLN